MNNHVYKTIEMTGSSTRGMQHAIENAIARASKSIRHIRWFEVQQTRGAIDQNHVTHWQVTLKISFKLDNNTDVSELHI